MISILLACREPEAHRPPPEPHHTAAPTCGLPDRSDPSTGRERVPTVRIEGTWTLNLGEASGVWVGDLDGDGCEELVAGETRADAAGYYQTRPAERVALIRGDAVSGPTTELLVVGDDTLETDAALGYQVTYLPVVDQLFVATANGDEEIGLASFDAPHPGQSWSERVGEVAERGRAGGVAFSSLVACDALGGRPSIVGGSPRRTDDDLSLFEGAVYVFDAPLVGHRDEPDARTRLVGEPGNEHPFLACDDDLDGDGATELVAGVPGADRVAILSDPPVGDHLVWDIASATIEGEPGTGFGEKVAVGDLDGDGVADLFAGARYAASGGVAIGCRGPFPDGGSRAATACEWVFRGEVATDFLHVTSVGDFDGDRAMDLAVARPRNPNVSAEGGEVLVYRGPVAPGTYGPDEADLVLRSAGSEVGNAFGMWLRRGDLDGNGADDLVMTAAWDQDAAGRRVGSIQILFGGPDVFP